MQHSISVEVEGGKEEENIFTEEETTAGTEAQEEPFEWYFSILPFFNNTGQREGRPQ